MAKSSGLGSGGEVQRVMDAARTPEWSIGPGHNGAIMATKDSGRIGLPWVVTATRAGRGMRVYKYSPGDDLDAEGEHMTAAGCALLTTSVGGAVANWFSGGSLFEHAIEIHQPPQQVLNFWQSIRDESS